MVDLDPQIQAVLDHMASQPQPDEPPSLDEVRAASREGHVALSPPPVESVTTSELSVPGPNGEVRCLVNVPRTTDEALPVLLYFHGGGCVLLDADAFNPTCTQLAEQADCIVVNVDYRLAPENPFPAPLDDAYTVYEWCIDHAADSGGGYLSAALCLDAKAKGAPQPVAQALVYPGVDAADRSESMITIDAFLNEALVAHLGQLHFGDNILDPRASPLRAEDHSGLAPALILAAGHDPLRDQGRAYAAVLRRAGVPVEYKLYEGTVHAFLTWGAAVDVSNQAVSDIASYLKTAFAA